MLDVTDREWLAYDLGDHKKYTMDVNKSMTIRCDFDDDLKTSRRARTFLSPARSAVFRAENARVRVCSTTSFDARSWRRRLYLAQEARVRVFD